MLRVNPTRATAVQSGSHETVTVPASVWSKLQSVTPGHISSHDRRVLILMAMGAYCTISNCSAVTRRRRNG